MGSGVQFLDSIQAIALTPSALIIPAFPGELPRGSVAQELDFPHSILSSSQGSNMCLAAQQDRIGLLATDKTKTASLPREKEEWALKQGSLELQTHQQISKLNGHPSPSQSCQQSSYHISSVDSKEGRTGVDGHWRPSPIV